MVVSIDQRAGFNHHPLTRPSGGSAIGEKKRWNDYEWDWDDYNELDWQNRKK